MAGKSFSLTWALLLYGMLAGMGPSTKVMDSTAWFHELGPCATRQLALRVEIGKFVVGVILIIEFDWPHHRLAATRP